MDELCITPPRDVQAWCKVSLSSHTALTHCPTAGGKDPKPMRAGFTSYGLIVLKEKEDFSNSQKITAPHALSATGTYHIKHIQFANPLLPSELLQQSSWARGPVSTAFVHLWVTGVCSVELPCCSSNKSFPLRNKDNIKSNLNFPWCTF